jgi:hypothetical protein
MLMIFPPTVTIIGKRAREGNSASPRKATSLTSRLLGAGKTRTGFCRYQCTKPLQASVTPTCHRRRVGLSVSPNRRGQTSQLPETPFYKLSHPTSDRLAGDEGWYW